MKKITTVIIAIFFVPAIIFSQKVNKSSAVQAAPPEINLIGLNGMPILNVTGAFDQNNEEYGTLDLTPATDDPSNSDDIKNKLWKDPNETLNYGGNFKSTGDIEASGRVTANTIRMISGAGAGKVLTSNASGYATWQTLSGGSGSIDGLSDGKSSPINANVYLGQYAGDSDNSTSFKGNTAVGYSALDEAGNTNEGENTAIGYGAMGEFTSGRANTAVGYQALHGFNGPAVGTENTVIGYKALYKNQSGTGNVAIGFEAGYDETGSDKLYIHNARTSFPLIWGDFQAADLLINGSLEVTQGITGTVSPSDERYKTNIKPIEGVLNKIKKLRGVTYNWRKQEFPNRRFSNDKQIGVIAQEIEEYFPELVETFDDGYKGVDYPKLTALFIEAIKEQQAVIEDLQKDNEEFRNQNAELDSRLIKLESLLDGKRVTKMRD